MKTKKKQIIITASVVAIIIVIISLMGCDKESSKTGTTPTSTPVATDSDAVTLIPTGNEGNVTSGEGNEVTDTLQNDNEGSVIGGEGSEATDTPTTSFEVIENEDGVEEVIISDVTKEDVTTNESGDSVVVIGGTEVEVETKPDGSVVVKDETVSETVKDTVKDSDDNKTEIVIGKDDKGNVSVATPTPTKKPVPTVTKTPAPVSTKSPTVTKKAEVTEKVEPVVTKTPTPTVTKKPTATPTKAPTATPTKKPTATPTKAPTNTPQSSAGSGTTSGNKVTPKPTVTPTPHVVEYITEITEVEKTFFVTTAGSRDGTILLWYFEHDTAPDYPYITSHVPGATAKNIQLDLDAGYSMSGVFVACCSMIGESYSVGVKPRVTAMSPVKLAIGAKYSDGTVKYYSESECFVLEYLVCDICGKQHK